MESSPYLKKYKRKCEVIPLGIDFKKIPRDSNKAKSIRKRYGKKIVLFIGRLVYYKGVEYLIEAMKKIDAELLIIGKGPLKNELNGCAGKNVHFLGEVDDVAPYYQACDVFVLPSVQRSEAFGIVQLEASVYKKSIVSTRLGTGVEFVNKYGLSVPPKDVKALKESIIKTLKGDVDVDKQYKYCKENFDISKIARKTDELYKNVYKS
jgi:rhamnosyl/mannosyltransferase